MAVVRDWKQLYDRYYRKVEIYDLEWDLDLDNYQVAAATYGGPVAVVRDDNKLVTLGSGTMRPVISIFNSAGIKISDVTWTWLGRLVKMGWTNDERLMCVQSDGTVYIYSVHGVLELQFSITQAVKDAGVYDCLMWGTGLVVLTQDFRLFSVDIKSKVKKELAAMELKQPPLSWAIVDPQYTRGGSVEVFISTESTLYVVDADLCQDQLTGPYAKMTISPNGQFVALLTPTGSLIVASVDLTKNFSEFDTKARNLPLQIAWCGVDSVVVRWAEAMIMISPYSDFIKYSLDSPVVLISERDCIRILGRYKCEILQRVPNEVVDIFKIGADSPAALLYDAIDYFDNQSPRADENIRAANGQLDKAVEKCIQAAGLEFDPVTQRQLLRAASFGKLSLDYHDPKSFVTMCRNLRVLNALRHYKVGMPMTYGQMMELTMEVVINRLINRHHHLLAFEMSEYLDLPKAPVLIHWACCKVGSQKDMREDDVVCEEIVSKLSNTPGISYVDIAEEAYRVGKRSLATLLLDSEPCVARQVPLLLRMSDFSLALSKAVTSGDTDLIYLVLFAIQNAHSKADLFNMIHGIESAQNVFIRYCREQDPELLKDFFHSLEMPRESANVMVQEAFKCTELAQRENGLKTAMVFYREHKDSAFQANTTEEEIVLLHFQRELVAATGGSFMDLSVSDTIALALKMGEQKIVNRMRTEFKIPDKRWWWLKVKALAEARDWANLDKFSKEKKSPIGYEPFVELCLEKGAKEEAVKYIPKVTEPARKVEYYVAVEMFKEAADVAALTKDGELLTMVLNKTTDPKTRAYIQTILARV